MFILLTKKTLSILKYISFDFLVRIVEVQHCAVPGVPSQKRKIYRSDSSLKDEGLLTALRKWTSGDKKVPFSFDRSSEQLAQLECFKQGIEVLHGGHVACQEQYNIIPMGQNFHSNAKYFHCSWHATWLPCKTSIVSIIMNTIKSRSVNSYVLFSGQVMSLYKCFLCNSGNERWLVLYFIQEESNSKHLSCFNK